MSNEKRSFEAYEYDINISPGYYDKVLDKGGIQAMWHELKFRNVSDFIQGGSGKSLLDIGCGPGSFSRFLDPQCVYTGTDFSAAQIQYATERYGGDNRDFKVTLAGEPWPFEDASFDYCSALELIEHLNAEEIHGLLSEAARVLRPGGRFLLSTPNYVSLWPLLEMIV
ncbi:MAG: class I SAM-dependent methyltransferase, partial [Pseudomonadota bacterium]